MNAVAKRSARPHLLERVQMELRNERIIVVRELTNASDALYGDL